MGEYMFLAVDAAGRPLGGVRIGHGRILCQHDEACPVCADYPFRPGSTTVRETVNPVVRITDNRFGEAHMIFGPCENNHEFHYIYMGIAPDNIEESNDGKVIHLHFPVGAPVAVPPPPPPAPPPAPPENEE
jgi:hypothetical protein